VSQGPPDPSPSPRWASQRHHATVTEPTPVDVRPQAPGALASVMVDLTDVSLAELQTSEDSPLMRALRRLDHEVRNPDDVSFSWDSSI
jgi:hypothetical protein